MRHNVARLCISAPRRYLERMEPPLRSGFVERPPATPEKRVPINKTFVDLGYDRLARVW